MMAEYNEIHFTQQQETQVDHMASPLKAARGPSCVAVTVLRTAVQDSRMDNCPVLSGRSLQAYSKGKQRDVTIPSLSASPT